MDTGVNTSLSDEHRSTTLWLFAILPPFTSVRTFSRDRQLWDRIYTACNINYSADGRGNHRLYCWSGIALSGFWRWQNVGVLTEKLTSESDERPWLIYCTNLLANSSSRLDGGGTRAGRRAGEYVTLSVSSPRLRPDESPHHGDIVNLRPARSHSRRRPASRAVNARYRHSRSERKTGRIAGYYSAALCSVATECI